MALWQLVQEKYASAVKNNALFSIEAEAITLPYDGVDFVIRIAKALQKKPVLNDQKHLVNSKSPFLPPYDPFLLVGSISATHVLLFNKFNIVLHHLLLVTKEYESQHEGLNAMDFEASHKLLQEKEGLVFFNCGPASGHSVLHKHLQFVPLPLFVSQNSSDLVPIEKLIYLDDTLPVLNTVFNLKLPFKHSCLVFSNHLPKSQTEITPTLPSSQQLEQYHLHLMERLNISIPSTNATTREITDKSYNFLMTRRWMLLILRQFEKCKNIPINGLGFTGSLYVKEEADFNLVKELGPMNILKSVCFPYDEQ